jgi:hypothetical protein
MEKRGIWKALFEYFQEIDEEWFMIDGLIIRANQCAAGDSKGSNEDLGRSCGGFATKIQALVDALENPVKFINSGRQGLRFSTICGLFREKQLRSCDSSALKLQEKRRHRQASLQRTTFDRKLFQ